jgi:hypothetical protein
MTFSGSAAVPYHDYDAGYYGAYTTPLPIIMQRPPAQMLSPYVVPVASATTPLPIIMQRPPAPMLGPYVVKNAAPVASIVKFSDGKVGQRMSEDECVRLVKKLISINQSKISSQRCV